MDLTTLKTCVPLGYLPWCKISGKHTFLLLQCVLSLMTSPFSFLQTVPSQGLCVTCPCVLDHTDVAIHPCSNVRNKKNFLQLLSSLWQATFLSFATMFPLNCSSQTMLYTAVSPWCLTERCTIFRLKGSLFKGIKVCLKGNTIPSSADWQSALSFVSCAITEQRFSSDLCLLAVSCWE